MRLFSFFLTAFLTLSLWSKEFKSGRGAIVCEKDTQKQTMTVKTEFSPGKAEKSTFHTLHWNRRTVFLKQKTLPFSSLSQGQTVWLYLAPGEGAKLKKGESFVCQRISVEAERNSRLGFRSAGKVCAPVYPLGKFCGEIEYSGKRIKFKAPENVTVFTAASSEDVKKGSVLLRIVGSISEKKFQMSTVIFEENTP